MKQSHRTECFSVELVEWERALIHRDTIKLLRLLQLQPDDITVLLTASTGVAAFNIVGMTPHAALLLNTGKFNTQPLSHDKLNSLTTFDY